MKFSHDLESKYDLETYYGRFFHFQEIINPKYTPIYFLNVFKNLLYSNPALNQYSDILRRHKENTLDKSVILDDKKLWEMKYG